MAQSPCSNMATVDAVFDRVPLHEFDADNVVWRVGKKAAGRILDGREWNELPAPNSTRRPPTEVRS